MRPLLYHRRFVQFGRFAGHRGRRVQSRNQIAPPAAKRLLEASQIIHRHIPGSRLDALQRAQIHVGTFGQDLLRHVGTQPQRMEIARNEDMPESPLLESGSICLILQG